MKKKIFFVFAVAAFAGALAFNSIVNSNKTTVSTTTLANIEALTRDETGPNTWCLQLGGGCVDPMWGVFWPNTSHFPGMW